MDDEEIKELWEKPNNGIYFYDCLNLARTDERNKRDKEWQAQIKEFMKAMAKHPLLSDNSKKWGKITMQDFIWQVSFYGFMPKPQGKKKETLATSNSQEY